MVMIGARSTSPSKSSFASRIKRTFVCLLLPFDQVPRRHCGCETDTPVDRDHDDQLLLAWRLQLQVLHAGGKRTLSIAFHRGQREDIGLVPSVGRDVPDVPESPGKPFSGTRSQLGRAGRAGGQPGGLSDSSGQTACTQSPQVLQRLQPRAPRKAGTCAIGPSGTLTVRDVRVVS